MEYHSYEFSEGHICVVAYSNVELAVCILFVVWDLYSYPRFVTASFPSSGSGPSLLLNSGAKLFITFKLKGFSTWERGTIFLCWLFHLPHKTRGTRCKASASSESQPSSSDAKTQLFRSDPGTQLTDFSQIPKILRAHFRCMTSFTSPGHIFYQGFLFWHLWMTHPPRAHVNTCAHVAPN